MPGCQCCRAFHEIHHLESRGGFRPRSDPQVWPSLQSVFRSVRAREAEIGLHRLRERNPGRVVAPGPTNRHKILEIAARKLRGGATARPEAGDSFHETVRNCVQSSTVSPRKGGANLRALALNHALRNVEHCDKT